jgi:hypothetical protein
MQAYQRKQEIKQLFVAALECSFYVAPKEPGLTSDELGEVGSRLSLQQGEITDAISETVTQYFGGKNPRLLPKKDVLLHWHAFIIVEEPDYRNAHAFDFLYEQFAESARAHGARNARVEHGVLVERAVAQGIPEVDIEAAIAICIFADQFLEKEGILYPKCPGANFDSPTQALKQNPPNRIHQKPARARVYPIVKDVIARRKDGRPKSAEPLAAFAGELEKLGYSAFRLWWTQLVGEYKQASRQTASVTVAVLAAALVEGVLTFVVKHARSKGLAVFRSSDFDGEPRSWKVEKLIASAASGGDEAILDQATKLRAEGLVQTRQRIHAGRMLSDIPTGPTDLKPEQARDAGLTAELVVGHVIEWLQRYPPDASKP